MRNMRKIKTAAVAVLLACGLVRADVFEKLPADALVVGKVANLTATSNKIAKLAKDLGIDAFLAPLQNPLAFVKTQSKMEKGINDAGDYGIAYCDPKDGPPDKSILMVIPVSNYADFLSNFGDAKTDGGVSEVTAPDDASVTLYVADWSGYAAVSPNKALVAKPAATLKVGDATAKEAAKQDFLIVANFNELGPKLMPQLDKGLDAANEQLEKAEGDKLDPKYKPLIKAALTQAFGAAKTFLNSTDAATIGLNIDDAGINTTILSAFKGDSYLGKLSSGMKGTDQPLTLGLPAMKYLAYGGSVTDPAQAAQVFDDLTAPIVVELNKIDGLDSAKKLVGEATAAMKKTTGATFGLPVPAKIGQEGLLQQVTIYRGGGAETKQLATDGVATIKQFLADMNLPPDKPKPTIEALQNAKSIEGVSFDTVKVDNKPNPDAPGAAQMEAVQNLIYGPNGMTYAYGTLGNDFLLVNGATDETVAAFIKSVKANEDNISKLDQVKAVAAELPKTRSVEYYVALDEMVNAGVAAAAQFNLPVQVQLPPDLPPLGMTFGADGNTMRFDSHLPTSTVQSLIAAGMQAFMGMRQGGGNL